MSLLQRVSIPSPNWSERGVAYPSGVRLIVLHSAEGATTFEGLGSYFQQPVEASSHVGIDNFKAGIIGAYVPDAKKSWTECGYNPVGVSAELCCPAGASDTWDRNTWLSKTVMMENTARWVAEECTYFGIPITALTDAQAQGTGRGVCQHSNLGDFGCGHHDNGPGFPMDWVIQRANQLVGTVPPVKPPVTYPPFPYPAADYLGQRSPDPHCHSGCYGGADTTNVKTWQGQMKHRGWVITVDGCYGPQSEGVCRQFQAEKSLAVDGLVGPNTWQASWTAPVT